MTDDMMNLRALLEKTPDADLLHDMIGFAAQRLMELEVEGLTGATYGEKSQDRLVQRNGNQLEALKRDYVGQHSIRINRRWRRFQREALGLRGRLIHGRAQGTRRVVFGGNGSIVKYSQGGPCERLCQGRF